MEVSEIPLDSNMKNYVNGPEIPMGLGMAMAKNEKAMEYFARLSEDEKKRVISDTSKIKSKKQMQAFADSMFTKIE